MVIRKSGLWTLALGAIAGVALAQTPKTTYINPIDIDYRYNFEQENEQISYRTGADPVIVRHKDAYYLFQTLAEGYWRSENLIDWTFITPSKWPSESIVAPAVLSEDDKLYLMGSRVQEKPIYVTQTPETGRLDYFRRLYPTPPTAVPMTDEYKIRPDQIQPGPWDPALFKDDDGKLYLYWGSSNLYPLYGIELDPETFDYRGTPTHLYKLDPAHHGWERFGQDHSGTLPNGTPINPFIEGAWMTKHGGKYYLQYGAPGTEYNAYANGTYVADSPLGPFAYAPYNPVAYKPGGFVQGAGHGSTFEDAYGNYWNTGTPWVGANWTFERRINLFPAGFTEDGQMWASSRFGDFPQKMPGHKIKNADELFTGWMLLSYKKPVVASSTMVVANKDFSAANLNDENPRTFWVAAQNVSGETLTMDMLAIKTVRALQINFADYQSGIFRDGPDIYTEFSLEASVDGKDWFEIARTQAPRRDRPNAYFELPAPVKARYVRYVHGHVGARTLAISDMRVFGHAGAKAPPTPKQFIAKRDKDRRNAHISWQGVKGAVGYNIRYGLRPDRLYLTYQRFGDQATQFDLRSLNDDVTYYVAIESFDENGVSRLSRVLKLR